MFVFAGFSLRVVHGAPSSPAAIAAPKSSPSSARAQVHVLCESKAGAKLQAPLLSSSQTPLRWFEAQQEGFTSDTARFRVLGEALSLAELLLDKHDEARRKQGFVLASQCAAFVAAQLPQEKWLLARVYQGFLLPQISLANVQVWNYPSRQRVLEAAVSAFGNAREDQTQKRVLEWLLASKDSLEVDESTLDWARSTLASLLIEPLDAPRADLERALTLLQAMQDTNKKAMAFLREPLEKRLLAFGSSSDTTPTSR